LVLSTIYAVLFYFAAAVFAVGLAYRIRLYARAPAPLKIPTTPAPVTRTGVVARLAKEVVFFESLFKANKWTWLFGWIFHFAMLLVLLRHLRYFTEPVWFWVKWVQPFGMYAGFAMVAGLAGLWVRRIAVERVRYISAPSDHLMLLLLIGICPWLDLFRLARNSRRPGSACASEPGAGINGHFPIFEIAAWARAFLQSQPQPGR